jgi:pimeloyl-ACP methyl ester carboxylesterase
VIERSGVVNAIPMRWLEHGEGTPVVLVHGIPTSPELWRHVVPHLGGGRCLAWDDYLATWLGHLDLDRVVLVGHDLGGGVAQIVAIREPERIAGLVLTNAIGYDSWPIPSVKAMQRMAAGLRRLPDAALYPMFVTLLRRGHDNRAREAESIGIHWRHYAAHGAAPSLMCQMSALNVHDTLAVADRLPGLRVPARVVWGGADQFQKVAYGERLARDLGARLERIDGGRHFTPEDHPDRIAPAINEICAAVD